MKSSKVGVRIVACGIIFLSAGIFAQGKPDGAYTVDWNQTLQAALKGVTRLKVVSGNIWISELEDGTRVEERNHLLFETNDSDDLESLIQCIEIDPEKSDSYCFCGGDPILWFYKGEERIVVSYHHGINLRWAGGPWPYDGALTDASRTQLFAWMDKHGVYGPRKEYEKNLRLKKEAQEKKEKRIAAMPASLARFFIKDHLRERDFKKSEIREMNEALSAQYPDKSVRILVLLGWYGSGGGSWDSFSIYEFVTKDLLLLYSATDILNVILQSTLSQNQTEGAARYWGREVPLLARKLMPVELKTKLLDHSLKSDDRFDRMKARDVFGEFQFYKYPYPDDEFIKITGYSGIKTKVIIPDAFDGVPITIIRANAFGETCSNITHIVIPSSITNIEHSAFSSCSKLVSISVDPANPNYESEDGILLNKKETTLIRCPEGKQNIVSLSDSIVRIGKNAFCDCNGLTQIKVPDQISMIGEFAFFGCSNLTQITLPSRMVSIESEAFGNSGLRQLVIPNSVTNIGEWAFAGCNELTHVSIPASVKTIEVPFADCASLTNIAVDPANLNYSSENGILMNKEKTVLVQYPAGRSGTASIPEGTTSILWEAFRGCNGLTQIPIPHGVTNIGARAFLNCENVAQITLPNSIKKIEFRTFRGNKKLTQLTLPDHIVSIEPEAFENSGLIQIVIPNAVTNIGEWAFANCNELESVYFLGDAPEMEDDVFEGTKATLYYLPNTTGWGGTVAGRPSVLRKSLDR